MGIDDRAAIDRRNRVEERLRYDPGQVAEVDGHAGVRMVTSDGIVTNRIGTRAAVENVGSRVESAEEGVVALAAIEGIEAGTTPKDIVVVIAGDRVAERRANDVIEVVQQVTLGVAAVLRKLGQVDLDTSRR